MALYTLAITGVQLWSVGSYVLKYYTFWCVHGNSEIVINNDD